MLQSGKSTIKKLQKKNKKKKKCIDRKRLKATNNEGM